MTAAAHHQHKKAKVKTVGHHQAHAKGLAPVLGDVACCVSEALAASLRLTGAPVSDADVLALHRAAGASDGRGAPVWAVLEAASAFGLGGFRLGQAFQPDLVPDVFLADRVPVHGLILGLELPGPHTVLATPEGWWSWGELYCPWCDFPDAVVDEAWAVSWR